VARALAARAGKEEEYKAFVDEVRRATDIERLATQRERRAFDLQARAVNPLNGEEVPVFASDYVLMEYGTGAIMAVPAHDQRDFEFAQQLGLPIRVVVRDPDGEPTDTAHEGEGVMVDSGPFTGMHTTEGKLTVIKYVEEKGIGKAEVQFRMRDWLISRQRYWGTPIPIVYCETCGIVPAPDSDLPIELPVDADYHLSDDAVSPLAKATEWVRTTCPKCGGEGRRETDTMDTFVDSSWYFLRFCDPHNDTAIFDREPVDAWMWVDQYTGGIDHAVMHLIYARFVTKVLHDMGLVGVSEPFHRLLNHGQISMGGKMMSKSLGNTVEPAEVMDPYGADTLRLHVLFINPPDAAYDWPPDGARACVGSFRFLNDVWHLVTDNTESLRGAAAPSGESELRRFVHQKLAAITSDYERWAYNTAVSKLMELRTELNRAVRSGAEASEVREGVDVVLHCLAPFCPYITEELWERLGGGGSIHDRRWPVADPKLVAVERVTMIVQVDSKVRDKIEVPADISEDEAVAAAKASPKVQQHLDGRTIARVIARPPGLVNLVTS
jgi:leucyl-tRNA synthetase